MPSLEPALPPDYSARLSASLGNWKRKLLDLSRRNRALNFKPAKVSTVAIIDEQPAEVFRRLYLDEAAMRFKAAPATSGDKPGKHHDRNRCSRWPESLFSISGIGVHVETE